MASGNKQRGWLPWTVAQELRQAEPELGLLRPGQPGKMRLFVHVSPGYACLASDVSPPEATFPRTLLSPSHEPQGRKALRDQLALLGLQRKPGGGGEVAGGGGDGELAASWGLAKPGGDSIKPHRGISSLLPSPAACRPGCRLSTPSSPRPAQSPSTQGWLSPSPGREWPVGLCQSELNSCTKLGSFCCSCPRPTPTPPLPPLCCESDLGGVRQRVTF